MTVHYPIGPSSLSRVFKCPGSLRLAQGRETTTSQYATEGSLAHDLAAKALTGEGGSVIMFESDEMADHVQGYVAFCRSILKNCSRWAVETTYESKEIREFGGTADFVAVIREGDRSVLHVVDFKYGAGVPVGVENNPQLLAYLLLAREDLGEHDAYRASIYQPRTSGEAAETVEYDRGDLEEFRKTLLDAISEERKDDFDAGD